MNPKLNRGYLLLILIVLVIIPSCVCQNDYETCRQPFECGNVRNIGYPFYGGIRPPACGYPGFVLTCQNNVPLINTSSINYRILDYDNQTQTVRVARDDLWTTLCTSLRLDTAVNTTLYNFASTNDRNISLFYDCTGPIPPIQSPNQFSCDGTGFFSSDQSNSNFPIPTGIRCSTEFSVRLSQTAAEGLTNSSSTTPPTVSQFQSSLQTGFAIQWSADNQNCASCAQSGGVCGFNNQTGSFSCHCADASYQSVCPNSPTQTGGNGGNSTTGRNIGLFIGGAVIAGVGLGWLIFYIRQRRKQRLQSLVTESTKTESKEAFSPLSSKQPSTHPSTVFTKSIPSYPSSNSDLGRASTYFGVQVFSYAELEEATDSFNPSRELGDGGFGTVYYGVLADGRIVAVKRLYENNFKRVEQFMNEVEILTKLRHENLVTLFGCTSKRSRELLLVYEYISNGTVADHLHGKRASSGLLSWSVRLNIAIETAEALAYLHSKTIIHRDVKTNNILLDNDFHVKVADFGLSRLFPVDATHVSTAPQGTPGYVDPEYYQCYQLTEKSDVYSFGVVLIELISSLQAVDTNRHRHDINLANMAINKIQNHTLHELVDSTIGFETNTTVRRMATLVAELAFRCLQQQSYMRPSMEEVLEALRGIKNEDFNAHKVEIVDIMVDDETGPLKGGNAPPSPDSVAATSSTPNSSA